jgi:NAD(P)H-nitrite reductase large subunit
MAFAAPAGGILCNELLNPVIPRQANNSTISRSDIIQQLSLLVGFLDWVSPSAPNGDLCGSCKTIIQRVLDQTLNGSAQNSALMGESFDFDLSSNFNDYFNFDLLDTFDWLRPELSSSQQSG